MSGRGARIGSRAFSLQAIAAGALLAACAAGPQGPPAVRWGTDVCSHCHMILGEERFAAVARGDSGEELRFDDLGCMLRWREGRDAAGWQVWAHDAGGPGWLAAPDAWYSLDVGLAKPMGSGLQGWSTREAAASRGGEVFSWSQLLARASPART